MIENGAELGPGTDVLLGQLRNPCPPHRGVAHFAAPFVKLGEPDQGHEIALVGFQRRFQRDALRGIVAGDSMGLREIEPERGCLRVGLGRGLEVKPRRRLIVASQRFHAEDIVRDRVVGAQP
jgi:hypothetical protein